MLLLDDFPLPSSDPESPPPITHQIMLSKQNRIFILALVTLKHTTLLLKFCAIKPPSKQKPALGGAAVTNHHPVYSLKVPGFTDTEAG